MTIKTFLAEIGYLIVALLVLHLVNPFDMAHIFGYLLLLACALYKKKEIVEKLDFDFLLLLMLGFTYSLFDFFGEHAGIQYLVIQAIFPAFLYILGKIIIIRELSQKNIIVLVIILIFTFSFTSLLSVISDLLKGGFTQTGRLIKNFWTGNGTKATQFANYLIYCMSLPPILIAIRKGYKWLHTVFFIIIYVLALLCVFRLGSRTGLFITIITSSMGLLILFSQQNFFESVKLVVVLLLIAIVVFNFFPINLESEYFSTLGHRLQSENTSSASSAGGRTELWVETLKNFYKYPLGGWDARRHAHNLWLDVAKVSGIIPFIFLITFNVRNIFNVIKTYKLNKTKYSIGINTMFTLFSISALTSFFVEPILEGAFFAFTFYCFFQGMLKSYLDNFQKYETANVRNN